MAVNSSPANEPADVTSGLTRVSLKKLTEPFCGKKSCTALAVVKVTVLPPNVSLPNTKLTLQKQ